MSSSVQPRLQIWQVTAKQAESAAGGLHTAQAPTTHALSSGRNQALGRNYVLNLQTVPIMFGACVLNASADRTHQETIQKAFNSANNNAGYVQASPCAFSFAP